MTLVEAYRRSLSQEGATRPAGGAALTNTVMIAALGCLWAGAFAARFGWF